MTFLFVRVFLSSPARGVLVALGLLVDTAQAGAQEFASCAQQTARTVAFTPLGGAEDRVSRLRTLVQGDTGQTILLRATTRPATRSLGCDGVWAILPHLRYAHNDALPWGANDGPLRAGVGHNALLSGGVGARKGRLSVVIAPQIVREDNGYVFVIPWDQLRVDRRSIWAHPYLPRPESADWPLRFGDEPRHAVLLGQSRVAVDLTPRVTIGASSENRWWGPSAGNGLLLSSHGSGFPHLFVETPRGLTTAVGTIDVQYLLGRLRESRYFDANIRNDHRALSAIAVVWRSSARWPMLPSLGISRGVIAAGGPRLDNVLDAFRDVGRPVSRPADAATHGRRDQITDLFARWAVPEYGVEAYAEWARYEFPASLADFIRFPGHTQGYSLGFQVARPVRAGGTVHWQAEVSYLEPSTSLRVRPTGLSYTSDVVPQGWTHDGQMLGPAIGPGGSAQSLAVDWHGREWRLGGTLGRIRWLNGPLFTDVVPGGQGKLPDVSLSASLRAAGRLGRIAAEVEVTHGVRLAYLNQALLRDPARGLYEGVDYGFWSVGMTLTPLAEGFFFRR